MDETAALRRRIAAVLDQAHADGLTTSDELAGRITDLVVPYLQAERGGAWHAGHVKGLADAARPGSP